jgi:hypothetical protein
MSTRSPSLLGHVNPIGRRSCYDEGKRCAETLFFDYHRENKVDIRVVRIFNTYGPRMHPNDGRVVSNFIVQALRGEDITLYGDGTQTRSFCYVSDLIEGFVRLMAQTETVGPVNIGNPGRVHDAELAELTLKLVGGKSKIVHKPLPSDDPKQRQPRYHAGAQSVGLGAEGVPRAGPAAHHRLLPHAALSASGADGAAPSTKRNRALRLWHLSFANFRRLPRFPPLHVIVSPQTFFRPALSEVSGIGPACGRAHQRTSCPTRR